MKKIILNGIEKETSDCLLKNLIEQYCHHPRTIIAEVNDIIIQQHQWEETKIQEGDRVELIAFMGGG